MNRAGLALCALAVTAVAGSGTFHVRQQRECTRLSASLAATTGELATVRTDLEAAGARAELLGQRTAQLEAEREQLQSRFGAAETRALGLSRDLDQARTVLTAAEAAHRQLQQEHQALQAELVQARLHAPGATPEEAAELRQQIGRLESQVSQLRIERDQALQPPRPARVEVLSVGAQNSFVVLDFGARQGAALNQLLLVRRGSAPLATVSISAVHDRHAIAHVLPDSLLGSLQRGDAATLLH